MIEILPATLDHALQLAGRLRAEDEAELVALGTEPSLVLRLSVSSSVYTRVAMDDGKPIALWGLAVPSLIGRTASPWLLTGPGVEKNKKKFLLESAQFVELAIQAFPHLENWCDARYERSLRWLNWLGFRIGEPESRGPLGMMFRHVEMGEA